jgi:CDP-diacylglycerol--glycerol-3-phosphate 3-phosphatidyltransferase
MRGLYAAKPWFVRRLARIEDLLVKHDVTADELTVAAFVVSICCGGFLALGGVLEQPLLWLIVPPLGLVRLALNALDGSIARRMGSGRPFGIVMNEVGDRLSDVALLAPLALVVEPVLALGALVLTLLASVTGLLGASVIGVRLSNGPMGKADRVAVLSAGSLVAATTSSPTPLGIAVAVVLLGSGVTAAFRVYQLRRETAAADVR